MLDPLAKRQAERMLDAIAARVEPTENAAG
jgi:hypothetical protein